MDSLAQQTQFLLRWRERALEQFVCQLYLTQNFVNLQQFDGTFKKSFAESRNCHLQKELLNNTSSALIIRLWCGRCRCSQTQTTKVLNYGWTIENNLYLPAVTHYPPAPKVVLELVRCKCVKESCRTVSYRTASCRTARCSCKRANVVCTEMCMCEASEDNPQQPAASDSDDRMMNYGMTI